MTAYFPVKQAVLSHETNTLQLVALATETATPYLSVSPHTAWVESVLYDGNVKQTMGSCIFNGYSSATPSCLTGTTALLKEIWKMTD